MGLMYTGIGGEVQGAAAQPGPTQPRLLFVALSPEVPPGNSQPFRQALAYAIDRDAVAKAANVDPRVTFYPASTIQHPKLPGFNPDAPGYSYDPAKAKVLYAQSAWSGPITITISPKIASWAKAALNVIRSSIQLTLGAEVLLPEAADLDRLRLSARRGEVVAISGGWISDRRDYGYPSFALALAHDLDFARRDSDLPLLMQRGDSRGMEHVLPGEGVDYPHRP
jgi:hypothetical protein